MFFLAFLCKFLINCGKVNVVAKNENGESEKEVINSCFCLVDILTEKLYLINSFFFASFCLVDILTE